MTYFRLGQAKQASKWLDSALAAIRRLTATDWQSRLYLNLLASEAKTLIVPKK